MEDEEIIAQWLSTRKGQKVRIVVPKIGQKEKLVELAEKNAKMVLLQDTENIKREELRTTGAMNQVGEWLGLGNVRRMEAFDISNISGYESVGSMVVFEDGRPKRSDYRKFRIKTVIGPNDYASMREVLKRRFVHGIEEREQLMEQGIAEEIGSFTRFPDLLLMDGGRGQVNIALEVLDELKLNIPVAGMVKDDFHRTRGIYFNNIEIPIDRHSEGFRLITRIQDEAHRFAIEYHRSLRGKDQVHSILDDIPGIGPTRRKSLMRRYKSLEAVQSAQVEELSQIPGMNRAAAENVYDFFHPEVPPKPEIEG
jgi:excinuclease ABC subunit C